MLRDTFVIDAGIKQLGCEYGGEQLECTFWTRADGQMSLHLFCASSPADYQPHAHSEYVIGVCLEGKITQTQLGQSHAVTTGQVLISNPGITHTTNCQPNGSQYCKAVGISFDRKLLARMAPELALPAIKNNLCPAFTGTFASEIIRSCARDIANELQQRKTGYKIILEAMAMRLVGEALRAWPKNQIAMIMAAPTARLSQRDFIRAYEFMRSCRKESFRVENLCNFLGSSEENFARLFSASADCPPATFYNRMLLQRARELLHHPRFSIKEIAFELGFKTSSHFIAAFRREFKVAPQRYREQLDRHHSFEA